MKKFPGYLKDLLGNEPVPLIELNKIPKRGIYVFYENKRPIYVGRSENLHQRLKQHCQQSSDHHSATFAFKIAKHDAQKKGLNFNKTREALQYETEFSQMFAEA